MVGRAKPRSGGIFIAWGVSPRNTGITTWTSRDAAAHAAASTPSFRDEAAKPRSGGMFFPGTTIGVR